MSIHRRPKGPCTVEIDKIKGSRFIADAAPAEDEAAAMAFVESIRARHSDAGHHCFAWRIGSDRVRSSDDGEPAGTAGAPILRRIEGAELDRTVVVVTRWFGGTRLGTGGLIRAYGGAAAAVLDEVEVVEAVVTVRVRIVYAYELSGPVAGVLAGHGLSASTSDYGEAVTIEVAVPSDNADAFAAEVRDVTSARAIVTVGGSSDFEK